MKPSLFLLATATLLTPVFGVEKKMKLAFDATMMRFDMLAKQIHDGVMLLNQTIHQQCNCPANVGQGVPNVPITMPGAVTPAGWDVQVEGA